MLEELMEECRKVGLEINAAKTKLMSTEGKPEEIWINQAKLELL